MHLHKRKTISPQDMVDFHQSHSFLKRVSAMNLSRQHGIYFYRIVSSNYRKKQGQCQLEKNTFE
ncbi:hypothetical protein C0966_00470 [Bacillus methanolicus]|nr:hypothetical protein [Bacillus methanolicus]